MEVTQRPHLHASWIDPSAGEIVKSLQDSGFATYLVGGCVRDLLAGFHPKDFDIATSATPQQVKKKIRGSYIIGKRFKLVLVKRGLKQYEVATFRRTSRPGDFVDGEAAPIGDNFFGTPEEDAVRRDFTINGLFYSPTQDELIDYVDGLADIDSQLVRTIGVATERIAEDPIRSLRAIRLTHKLGFQLDPELRAAIQTHAETVSQSVLPRKREEYLKIFRLSHPGPALCELYDLGLMNHLFPSLIPIFSDSEKRELFLSYVEQMADLPPANGSTIELYAPIVLAYTRTLSESPQMNDLRARWMRDELGMFKAEQSGVLNVISLIHSFPKKDSFLKRNHRRQQSFLQLPNLDLALRLAAHEFTLSAQEYSFWYRRIFLEAMQK